MEGSGDDCVVAAAVSATDVRVEAGEEAVGASFWVLSCCLWARVQGRATSRAVMRLEGLMFGVVLRSTE